MYRCRNRLLCSGKGCHEPCVRMLGTILRWRRMGTIKQSCAAPKHFLCSIGGSFAEEMCRTCPYLAKEYKRHQQSDRWSCYGTGQRGLQSPPDIGTLDWTRSLCSFNSYVRSKINRWYERKEDNSEQDISTTGSNYCKRTYPNGRYFVGRR